VDRELIPLNEFLFAWLKDYPQVRFNQEGSNFSYFSEDLVEIPEQESVIHTTSSK
jgi:hypothetical protein